MRDQIKSFVYITLFALVLNPLPMESQARLTMRAGIDVSSTKFANWDYTFYYQGRYLDNRAVYVSCFYNLPTFQVGMRSANSGSYEGGYGMSIGKAKTYGDRPIEGSTVFNRNFLWVDSWLRKASKIDIGIGSQIAWHTIDVKQKINVMDYELGKSIKYQVGTRWKSKGYELAFISRISFGDAKEHAIHFSLGFSAQMNEFVGALHESGRKEPTGVERWGSSFRAGLRYAYIFGKRED
jgi:hypothetical protein